MYNAAYKLNQKSTVNCADAKYTVSKLFNLVHISNTYLSVKIEIIIEEERQC